MELHYLGLVPPFLMITFWLSLELEIEHKNKRSYILAFIATLLVIIILFGGIIWFINGEQANAIEVTATVPTTAENCLTTCKQECEFNY